MKKIRQRYILFEVITNEEVYIQEKDIIRNIWKRLQQLFGENKSFKAGLWMIHWDPTNLIGILRFDHLVKSELICGLSLIKSIDEHPVIFHCRKTTGTIKTAKELWLKTFITPIPEKKK